MAQAIFSCFFQSFGTQIISPAGAERGEVKFLGQQGAISHQFHWPFKSSDPDHCSKAQRYIIPYLQYSTTTPCLQIIVFFRVPLLHLSRCEATRDWCFFFGMTLMICPVLCTLKMPRISKNDQTGNDVDKLLLDAVPNYASGIPCVAARHSATFSPEPQCAQKFVEQEMMEMRDVQCMRPCSLSSWRTTAAWLDILKAYLGVHADRNRSLRFDCWEKKMLQKWYFMVVQCSCDELHVSFRSSYYTFWLVVGLSCLCLQFVLLCVRVLLLGCCITSLLKNQQLLLFMLFMLFMFTLFLLLLVVVEFVVVIVIIIIFAFWFCFVVWP